MAGSRQMTREEAIRYIKSAAGHLIATDRQVVGMALLEAWDALRQPGWVRTADRVPEGIGDVLVVWNGHVTLGLFEGSWYYLDPERLEYRKDIWNKVTHFMPLPPLPETVGLEGTKINGGE